MQARMDMIGLVVEDLAASVAFYRLLGLEFPEGSESTPHVEATLPGGIRFALDPVATVRSFHPGWTAPTGSPRINLAFLVDAPAEVDTLHDALVASGASSDVPPFDARWGQRYATVLDPDGNGVDIFAELPGASG